MRINEQLWRVFQSRFAKLLNKLPKEEQKEFFFIFGLRKDFESNFDFNNIERLLRDKVAKRKAEKKRTKLLRRFFGLKEEKKQTMILTQTAQVFAKGVFENKSLIYRDNTDVFHRTIMSLQEIALGCKFYPCEKKN